MEQSQHKKVYINPNFKRTETESWPKVPTKTTHFNRRYLEEMPNRLVNPLKSNNRKIYVNPNFVNSNNTCQGKPITDTGYQIKPNDISKSYNIQNTQLLHKSKYSIVKSIQQTGGYKEPVKMETNKSNDQTIPELNQHTKKSGQEVPMTRSKYCIIRKKKRLSINNECKNVKTASMLHTNVSPVPTKLTNQFMTCTHIVHNNISSKLNHNTPEKITKIKITKYKTVPISYLRKNAAMRLNKNKFVASPLKSYLKRSTKLNSSLITCNINRYKFIKPNSPVIKSSTPVSTVKATSKIVQYKAKVKTSAVKLKLSRAKFNVNNIPCRLFTKFGKCLRQDQGNCKYLHDKKHVMLCHQFLKGICHNKNCTLSHELTDKKMPTCYFYLKGMCTKECCPYLHVKLSDKSKICQEFAKGYCESGDKCLFRHVNVSKTKARKISLNSSKDKVKTKQQEKPEKIKTENCIAVNLEESQTIEEDCRYYKELVNSDDGCYEIIKPTRCKLGILPSFIQL